MLIVLDHKMPPEAKHKLREYGELLELQTSGITYEAISGHPDVFFHQMEEHLVLAPNLPEKYKAALRERNIPFTEGEQDVGEKYPASSAYNAVSIGKLLIHNFRNTDSMITRLADDADLIHVDQGYTRCNLLALDEQHFITSDEKIARVLKRFEKDCLYVPPQDILLPGFKHGFFGGCCGLWEDKLFLTGSLREYPEGDKLTAYLEDQGVEILELYPGPLFDVGSILFIP